MTARVNLDEAAANATECIREHADDPDDGIDGCPNCRLARDVIALVEEVRRRNAVLDALPRCEMPDCARTATRRYDRHPGMAGSMLVCDVCKSGSWHAVDLEYAAALRALEAGAKPK